jgi:hypothetical protein
MKFVKYLMLSAMFTLLIPASGFARTKDQGTMMLMQAAEIGSTQLQPGTYKVEWSGTGPTVHVNILHHRNVVASTTAELKTDDSAVSQDAVVIKPAANNSSEEQIAEIDFGKHKQALVITPTFVNSYGGQ